jgi:hypothetical protein
MRRGWLGASISAVVTVLSVLTMVTFGSAALVEVAADSQALSCDAVPGEPQPFEGNSHLPYDDAVHPPYKTKPPTSGPHSRRVVTPGIYREPISEELQIHALEHGHVLVQYAPATRAADIETLERIGRRHPRQAIVASYPGLDRGVGLTGWQRIRVLESLDEKAVDDFITKVAGRYNHGWQNGATDCL